MMMSMLQAGGMDLLTDNERKADIDNPRGYFEFERVKKVKEDPSWLKDTGGRAVKMVARLLYDLPEDLEYQVIFMKRNMQEMLLSQDKMLDRLGKPRGDVPDARMAGLFAKELAAVEGWLRTRDNMRVLYVDYGDVVARPEDAAERIYDFIIPKLDVRPMAGVVDEGLYRNR